MQQPAYENSWLKQLYNVYEEHAKADEHFKELKKAVETGWNGKNYTFSFVNLKGEIFKYPLMDYFKLSDSQLKALRKDVLSTIREFQEKCFFEDFVKLFEKLNSIDPKKEALLKFRIGMALESIKKYVPDLEKASKHFNYDAYFNKLNEMNVFRCVFLTKIGDYQPFIEYVNKGFDVAANAIMLWFEKNGNIVDTMQNTKRNIDDFSKAFMDEMVATFGKNIHSQLDEKDLKKETILKKIQLKRDSIPKDKNPNLHELLDHVHTVLVHCFQIQEHLSKMYEKVHVPELLRQLEPNSFPMNQRIKNAPPTKNVDTINEKVRSLLDPIQHVKTAMDQFCYGEDALALFTTFDTIDSQMNIPKPLLQKIHHFATETLEYYRTIERAQNSLASNSNQLISSYSTARQAISKQLYDQISGKNIHQWIQSVDTNLRKIVSSANSFLINSFEPVRRAKDAILSDHRKMMNFIISLLHVQFDKKSADPHADPPLPIEGRKTVTFDIKTTEYIPSSVEFEETLLEKLIDDKIKMFNSKKPINKLTEEGFIKIKMIMKDVTNMQNKLKLHRDNLTKNKFEASSQFISKSGDQKYPTDTIKAEINEQQKTLLKLIGKNIRALEQLRNRDIHRQIYEIINAFEKDPKIKENFNSKNIPVKCAEFNQLDLDETFTHYKDQISGLRTNAAKIMDASNPIEMFREVSNNPPMLIEAIREIYNKLTNKMKTVQKIISDSQVLNALETIKNILFERLIDEKIKLLPSTSGTRVALKTMKKITNIAFDMHNRFELNLAELEKADFDQLTANAHPPSVHKMWTEANEKRNHILDTMKRNSNELKLFYNGDIPNQIFITVTMINKYKNDSNKI